MLKVIYITLILTVVSTFAQDTQIDSINGKNGPVVYFGIETNQTDYNTVITNQPVLYRNKVTKRDTVFMDQDTTRYFYSPRIIVIGYYTTYRDRKSILLEGMEIITSVDEMDSTIKSHCDKYSLVKSPASKCMVYVDNIPTHADELSYVTELAHDTFINATGCEAGRDCVVFPLFATVR
jgi:hypothetical protein